MGSTPSWRVAGKLAAQHFKMKEKIVAQTTWHPKSNPTPRRTLSRSCEMIFLRCAARDDETPRLHRLDARPRLRPDVSNALLRLLAQPRSAQVRRLRLVTTRRHAPRPALPLSLRHFLRAGHRASPRKRRHHLAKSQKPPSAVAPKFSPSACSSASRNTLSVTAGSPVDRSLARRCPQHSRPLDDADGRPLLAQRRSQPRQRPPHFRKSSQPRATAESSPACSPRQLSPWRLRSFGPPIAPARCLGRSSPTSTASTSSAIRNRGSSHSSPGRPSRSSAWPSASSSSRTSPSATKAPIFAALGGTGILACFLSIKLDESRAATLSRLRLLAHQPKFFPDALRHPPDHFVLRLRLVPLGRGPIGIQSHHPAGQDLAPRLLGPHRICLRPPLHPAQTPMHRPSSHAWACSSSFSRCWLLSLLRTNWKSRHAKAQKLAAAPALT